MLRKVNVHVKVAYELLEIKMYFICPKVHSARQVSKLSICVTRLSVLAGVKGIDSQIVKASSHWIFQNLDPNR